MPENTQKYTKANYEDKTNCTAEKLRNPPYE